MENIKPNVKLDLNKLTVIFVLLIIISIISGIYSVYLNLIAQDIVNIQNKFTTFLFSDLFRYIALFMISITGGLKLLEIIKKGKESKMFIYSLLIFVIIGILGALRGAIPVLKDLETREILQQEGVVIVKDYKTKLKGGREYYLYLNNSYLYFIMKGDLLKNGYVSVNEGDKVRIWYSKNTQQAYFVKVLN